MKYVLPSGISYGARRELYWSIFTLLAGKKSVSGR